MEKELFDYVAERAGILATADTSKQDTKDAAAAWKDACLLYTSLAACGIANGIAGRYEIGGRTLCTHLISAGNPICDTARS